MKSVQRLENRGPKHDWYSQSPAVQLFDCVINDRLGLRILPLLIGFNGIMYYKLFHCICLPQWALHAYYTN